MDPSGDLKLGSRYSLVRYSEQLFAFSPTPRHLPEMNVIILFELVKPSQVSQ